MLSLLGHNRRADIAFATNGCIDISAKVAKALSLHNGDTIDVLCNGYDYYLYVRNHAPEIGRYEAQCRQSNRRGHHFRAYSARLCAIMRRVCHADGKICLPIGETVQADGKTYVSLITKHNLLND